MKIIPFLYREQGKGRGYGFVQGKEMAVKCGCERYMNFACDVPGESIRFTELENGWFMLLYVVAVPKGTLHESRGQVIASGYLFRAEEADELMRHPEYIFELEHCTRAEDMLEEKITDWEQICIRTRVKESRAEQMEKSSVPRRDLRKPYFASVIANAEDEMTTQVFHVLSDYSEESVKAYLIKGLKIFPARIRKFISFNTNVKKITEAGKFEWNFLKEDTYAAIEAGGFAGGRAIERTILKDGKIISFRNNTTMTDLWREYVGIIDSGSDFNDIPAENKKEFILCLQERKKKDLMNGQKEVEKISRNRHVSKKLIRCNDIKKLSSVILRLAMLLSLSIWTSGALHIMEFRERTYMICFSLDTVCAAALFGIAFLTSSLVFDLKWWRMTRKRHKKRWK